MRSHPRARVGVWGLAYKEDTHSTKNSPALTLLAHLDASQIAAYDPQVDGSILADCRARSALDALDNVDALCIMTPWPEFRTIEPADIAKRMRGDLIIDPHGMLTAAAVRNAGMQHITLGVL